MPNWCSTDYYVVGSKKEVLDLNKKMERLENRKKSLVKMVLEIHGLEIL